MKKLSFLLATAVLAAAGATHVARAADTPGSNPSVRMPSTSERLAAARKMIYAKDWQGALRELNTAARDEPRNADVQNLLGYTHRKKATPDLAKAFEHYRNALALDPKHKGAHEYIGEAYLMDKKPAEAEKHLAQLEQICGNKTCEEYQDLAKAVAEYKAKN
jgi:Flp pilus assembly protein TadD